MALYYPGDPVRLILATVDASGAPVDVTSLTVSVYSSDGQEQASPAVVHDGTGSYHADFLIPSSGDANSRAGRRAQWPYRWSCTNGVVALNGVGYGAFTVVAPPAPFT